VKWGAAAALRRRRRSLLGELAGAVACQPLLIQTFDGPHCFRSSNRQHLERGFEFALGVLIARARGSLNSFLIHITGVFHAA